MGIDWRFDTLMPRSFIAARFASVRKRFTDTFTRANTSGSLGTATDGSRWTAVRGVFTVSSNKAAGDSTSYPIATQPMPFTNSAIEINDLSQGTGAAIWVTDSGNWWAVGIDTGSGVTCNCQTCYNASTNNSFTNPGFTNPYTCSGGNYFQTFFFQNSNGPCPAY